jgi:MFS family permease
MGIAAPARQAGGIGTLVRLRAFRVVLVANVLSAIAFGTGRFVFVWLIGELTEWNPATAVLGIVIGIPPLALSAWAGSLADRLSARRLGTALFAISIVAFAVTGTIVTLDAMTVPLAMVCGFVAIAAPSMLIPLIQALVPSVTPPEQLMQAVALQNLSMMVSTMGGIFVGGAAMQVWGTQAGFWLLAIASAIGCIVVSGSTLPDRLVGASATRGSIRDGARVALGTEPLRSLLAVTAVMGIAIATSALLLPEFARDVLDQDSLAASGLNVVMSVGMMVTSMVLATRWRPAHPGRVLAAFGVTTLGGGLIGIGLSRTYVVTALVCFGWGLCGGIAMTLMRTLMQQHTPPELMGRVMGLAATAQNGAFPIAAILLFGLVAALGVSGALVITGVICCALVAVVIVPPTLRELT